MLGHRELQWKGDRLMLGNRNTGAKVIPDSKWPNMYRLEYPPGVISDMANLTRIRDAAIDIVAYHLNHPTHKTHERAAQEAAGFANRPTMGPDSLQTTITQPSSLAA